MNLQKFKDGEKVIGMNKVFESPKIEIIHLDVEDVFTTSSGEDWRKDTELDEV